MLSMLPAPATTSLSQTLSLTMSLWFRNVEPTAQGVSSVLPAFAAIVPAGPASEPSSFDPAHDREFPQFHANPAHAGCATQSACSMIGLSF